VSNKKILQTKELIELQNSSLQNQLEQNKIENNNIEKDWRQYYEN
jgi:hypothetical protein